MKIEIDHSPLKDWKGSVLVLGSFEGEATETVGKLDGFKGINVKELLENLNFTGKKGDIETFQLLSPNQIKLILLGLGEAKDFSIEELRKATAQGIKASNGTKGKIGFSFPWELFQPDIAAKAVAEASNLCLFKDLRFRNHSDKNKALDSIDLIGLKADADECLKEIAPIVHGVNLARELVGAPPNKVTPESLAETALEIAKEYGLEITILDEAECAAKGMGAYLAVAKGSDLKPKFIHLAYKASGPIKRKLAIIGKGLTFDSGGYNLKVGASQIEMMKYDMGGSAAVIGAARSIAEIQPENIEVHFIVASCENMINGSAVHPGDIVTASNGKTIEINNTDAEGRLTLADALVYASQLKPDAIIDLATLTGACVIALGEEIAGLWTENDELSNEIIKAANSSGEGIWRMPLHESYKDGLKSLLADLKNTGPRAGGSITAALFLKEFVGEGIPWAHIDIAGTVWTEKGRGVNPAGATGYGVRTLVNWIKSN